jgi:UMF1 family MFS transporter
MGEPPAAGRRQRFAWCLFDFANSSYNTVVVTFLWVTFFAEALVGDKALGNRYWGTMLVITGVVVAIASPLLGALADRTAHKRRYLVVFSLVTIIGTALLFFPSVDPDLGRATDQTLWFAMIVFVVANICFELAFVFYNSFLPQLGNEEAVGRLSGNGWAFGYVGGLLCLGLSLLIYEVLLPDTDGLNVRAANLLVAGWFLLFALPMFLWVKDRSLDSPVPRQSLREAGKGVMRTIRALRHYPDLLRLLIARLVYNDAVIALISLSGLYMIDTLAMDRSQILTMGIGLNVAAGLGAFGFGFVDDRVGARFTILASLVLLISGTVLAIAVPTVTGFTGAATLVGLGLGPNQSASRSLMRRFVDPRRSAEFFGLFALSGKATVWIGPLLFTLLISAGYSQRIALTPLIGMFVVGLLLLVTVNEKRGILRARQESREP